MLKQTRKQSEKKSSGAKTKDTSETWSVKGELYLVLDFGTSLLKAGLVRTDPINQRVFVLDYAQAPLPLGCFGNQDTFDIKTFLVVIDSLFNRLETKNNVKAKYCLIGASSRYLSGQIFSFSFARQDPREKISFTELENIFTKTIRQVKEKIKEQLKRQSDKPIPHLIESRLLYLTLDGYRIEDPQGLIGQKLEGELFNTYTQENLWQQWQELINFYKKKKVFLRPCFWLLQEALADKDCLLIDVGDQNTEVVLRQQGLLVGQLRFGIGGSSFSYALVESLGIGRQEAEEIKLKYARRDLGSQVCLRLDKVFQPVLKSWLEGLFVVLNDVAPNKLLSEKIYLTGGGALMPSLLVRLREEIIHQDLTFLDKKRVQISYLAVQNIEGVEDRQGHLTDTQKISIACLAKATLNLDSEVNPLHSLLKKALKLNF